MARTRRRSNGEVDLGWQCGRGCGGGGGSDDATDEDTGDFQAQQHAAGGHFGRRATAATVDLLVLLAPPRAQLRYYMCLFKLCYL